MLVRCVGAGHVLGRWPWSGGSLGRQLASIPGVGDAHTAEDIVMSVNVHEPASNDHYDPLLTAGQVHGGIAQGLGQALLEDMVYSPEGQPLTGTFLDYALPRASTTPAFTLDAVETPSPLNPLGAKGIGELPALAAPAAIANAVMDALSHVGVRHIDTPLTPNLSLFVARKNCLKSWESPPSFSANLVKIEEFHRGLLGYIYANCDHLQTLIH